MSQPSGTKKGDLLDASAKEKASNAPVGRTKVPCAKPWTLNVLAATKNKEKGTGSVTILAGARTASVPFWEVKQFTETQGTEFTDDFPDTFDVSAEADEWISEGAKTVSLNNGDHKVEMLLLRPRPWIGFHFIDEKTTKDVGGIQLSLKLPRKGEIEETYTKEVLKITALDPGQGEVQKTVHEEVWSVEKVEQV